MKWGELPGDSRDLLFWVLWFAIGTYADVSIDHLLKHILVSGGGIGGDPRWDVEHIPDENGLGHYRVRADKEFSGLDIVEADFKADLVRIAIKEMLICFAKAHPLKVVEVEEVIAHYGL